MLRGSQNSMAKRSMVWLQDFRDGENSSAEALASKESEPIEKHRRYAI